MANQTIKIRNYGIDLLRLFAMYMVVVLHTMGHGGILDNVKQNTSNYWLAWFIETAAYCAVDVFAMITGFVMVNSKFNGFKIIPLWLTVFFYSIGISLIFRFIPQLTAIHNVSIKELFIRCLPISSVQYWYFSRYVGLFFFIPFVNILIKTLDKKKHGILCLTIIAVYSIFPLFTLNKSDIFSIGDGYSCIWLLCLYIIGAYFKLYPLEISKKKCLLFYLVTVILSIGVKFLIQTSSQLLLHKEMEINVFLGYTNITTIGSAIFLLILFSQIEIRSSFSQGIITVLGQLAFSVYLIHEQPLIRDNFIEQKFIDFAMESALIMLIKILSVTVMIFCICLIIDLIRFALFKILKINSLPKNLLNKFIQKDE